ncbi:hypothetical protein STZ1_30039 [Bacillus subtilis]
MRFPEKYFISYCIHGHGVDKPRDFVFNHFVRTLSYKNGDISLNVSTSLSLFSQVSAGSIDMKSLILSITLLRHFT